MENKNLGIYTLAGMLISTAVVGYFVRKQNEKHRKESEELVKNTTEQIMKDAFSIPKFKID